MILEVNIPMKLVRLIKMRLNHTYNKACICKHFSDTLPTQNGLKQDAYHHHFSTLFQNTPSCQETWTGSSTSGLC
jgi:hypothetical protein